MFIIMETRLFWIMMLYSVTAVAQLYVPASSSAVSYRVWPNQNDRSPSAPTRTRVLHAVPVIQQEKRNQENELEEVELAHPVHRKPEIWTIPYQECWENSKVKITSFNATYSRNKDIEPCLNIKLEGQLVSAATTDQEITMYVELEAFGRTEFSQNISPCSEEGNLSFCNITQGQSLVVDYSAKLRPENFTPLPGMIYNVPDIEGMVKVYLLPYNTDSETVWALGCATAQLTNGKTFSHPRGVTIVLFIIIVASALVKFCIAIYNTKTDEGSISEEHESDGQNHGSHHDTYDELHNEEKRYTPDLVPTCMIFDAIFHIYFTCALSIQFPKVLYAFWSNLAPSAGLWSTKDLQSSFDNLARVSETSATKGLLKRGQDYNEFTGEFRERFTPFAESTEHDQLRGFAVTLYTDVKEQNAFTTFLVFWVAWIVALLVFLVLVKIIIEMFAKRKPVEGESSWKSKCMWVVKWFAYYLLRSLIITSFPFLLLATHTFYQHPVGPSIFAGIMFGVIAIITLITFCIGVFFGTRLGSPKDARRAVLELSLDYRVHQAKPVICTRVLCRWLMSGLKKEKVWRCAPLACITLIKGIVYGAGAQTAKEQCIVLLVLEVIAIGVIWNFPWVCRKVAIISYAQGAMRILTLALLIYLPFHEDVDREHVTRIGLAVITFQGLGFLLTTIITLYCNFSTAYITFGKPNPINLFRPSWYRALRTTAADKRAAREHDIVWNNDKLDTWFYNQPTERAPHNMHHDHRMPMTMHGAAQGIWHDFRPTSPDTMKQEEEAHGTPQDIRFQNSYQRKTNVIPGARTRLPANPSFISIQSDSQRTQTDIEESSREYSLKRVHGPSITSRFIPATIEEGLIPSEKVAEKPVIASSYKSTTSEDSGGKNHGNRNGPRKRRKHHERQRVLKVVNMDRSSRNNCDSESLTSPTSIETSKSSHKSSASEGTQDAGEDIEGEREHENELEKRGESRLQTGVVSVSTPVFRSSEIGDLRSIYGSIHDSTRALSIKLQRRGAVRVPDASSVEDSYGETPGNRHGRRCR